MRSEEALNMLEVLFDDRTRLLIPEGAIERVRKYKDDVGFRNESGGIILGGQSESGLDFIVNELTLPSPTDDSGPYHYMRDKHAANKLIENAWEESGGTVNYLGEWHTHNERRPHPSYVDKNLMRQVSENESCLFDRAFMMILGFEGVAFLGMVEPRSKTVFMESQYVRLY